eukprot:gnl/MRDRNA2_/MRDRNA2_211948_c0_seq1.p1 gnl/MRDRNA2_/MRDRNA2_211948_c0~~gnl/MRDRNA2_/MRDRNA2_211948_c0_seq1.p1  ORF type:complete len:161 (-),score=21.26 gnl/MRDRNA2_/MRDRNA2_211948_c0_seq1:57-539(-)
MGMLGKVPTMVALAGSGIVIAMMATLGMKIQSKSWMTNMMLEKLTPQTLGKFEETVQVENAETEEETEYQRQKREHQRPKGCKQYGNCACDFTKEFCAPVLLEFKSCTGQIAKVGESQNNVLAVRKHDATWCKNYLLNIHPFTKGGSDRWQPGSCECTKW